MKERAKKAAMTCAIAAAICAAVAAFYIITGLSLPCVFHDVTGLKCPGCGNTAAVLSLLRFDFKGAVKANCFAPLEALYAAFVIISYIADYVKTGKKQLLPRPEFINICFLIMLIAWAVGRNIFGL